MFVAVVSIGATDAVAQTNQAGSDTTGRFLVGSGQYRFYSCDQLAVQVKASEARQRELLALIAKAKQGPGGGLVAALSYEPDLAVTHGQLAELRREQTDKKCPPGAASRPAAPELPARRR